jgi:periplasmic protein CpxP/Spy
VKSTKLTFTAIAAVLTLCAGLAFAAGGAAGPMHHHHGDMGGFEQLLHQLNLTDDQKAQVKQMVQADKPTMRPLMQQEHAAHQQMIQLVTSGSFETAKAAAIAQQESQTHMQLEVEHAKIASQIYQLLSSDQKAKVAELIAQHEQRMQEHMQKQEQSTPAQQ